MAVTNKKSTLAKESAAGAVAVRARIVETARTHFFRYGFARFTMDDLATDLGMSKKTLYQHFRRKEALVDELVTVKASAVIAGANAVLSEPGLSFSERAARLLAHIVGELGEISTVFLRDLRRFAPEVYERLEQMRARNLPLIWERLLATGISAGAVRAEIETGFIARVIVHSTRHLLQPDVLEELRLQPHELIDRYFNLLFVGLLTSKGRADHENKKTSISPAAPQ